MKSFADWTDEIHDLMNPPKPMVDRCNWTHDELSFYEGSQWPETIGIDPKWAEELRKPVDFSRYLKDMVPVIHPYQEAIVKKFCEQWEEAIRGTDALTTGASIHQALEQALRINSARRTGKSWMQRQMMEALTKDGQAFYEVTPTGRIKFHGDNELLKRGIIQDTGGMKQMVHFSQADDPCNPQNIPKSIVIVDEFSTIPEDAWNKL